MNSKLLKIGIVTVIATSLFTSPATYGSTVAFANNTNISSSSVQLSSKASIALKDAHFLMQSEGKLVAFTIAVTNNDSKSINMLDYWVKLKNKSGKSYTVKILEADKTKTLVRTNSTVYITYYAYVEEKTKISDLQYEIIKWDFSSANYEKKLGVLTVPTKAQVSTPAFKGSLMLYDNINLKGAIKHYSATQDKTNTYLTLNFLFENSGKKSVSLSKLKLFIQSEGQSVFDTEGLDLTNVVVQPKERKIVTLYATIPNAEVKKKLALTIATNDGTNPISIPIGSYALPTIKTNAAATVSKNILLNGESVSTNVSNIYILTNEKTQDLSIDYSLVNQGSTSVDLPELNFALKTKNGILYPLTSASIEDKKLLPKFPKILTMTGKIPKGIDLNGSELIVSPATLSNKGYVLANYSIKLKSNEKTSSQIAYGDYSINLSKIQRSSLENKDIIMSELKVTNTSTTSKKTIDIGGFFVINGVKVNTSTTGVTQLEQKLAIEPNASVTYIIYSEIPYTTEIKNLALALTEKIEDQPEKQLFQFTNAKISEIEKKDISSTYSLLNAGQKAEARILNTAVYEGVSNDFFYTEVEYRNTENRSQTLIDLSGFLQSNTGAVIPVTFNKYKEKLFPNESVIISAWTKVPKNINSNQYQFVMGQALKPVTSTPAEENYNGAVARPVAFILNENKLLKTEKDYKNILFNNYDFSLRDIYASVDMTVSGGDSITYNGISLSFKYDLKEDQGLINYAEKPKLIFEIIDQVEKKTTYSKTLLINSVEENAYYINVGENIAANIKISDPDIMNKLLGFKTYMLNVYKVVGDNKLLLASNELKWYTTENK